MSGDDYERPAIVKAGMAVRPELHNVPSTCYQGSLATTLPLSQT
jgi:hypothetical protein